MGNPRGFLDVERKEPGYRPVAERLKDFKEVETRLSDDEIKKQSSRCMDCGVPFCHGCGCPLSNSIPEFNDLVYRNHWKQALDILLSTNNFPEFTGRVCPALCEASCTVGMHGDPVLIRQIELSVVEKGFQEGYIVPRPPAERTGKKVAVIGSGPAGLAMADQLNKMGHQVTVYERDLSVGGLLRYGIPDFKLDKGVVQRRVDLMAAEGVVFETGIEIGKDISGAYLLKRFDAICLANGAKAPRDLKVPGRELDGIHFAMELLHQQNRRVAGEPVTEKPILAQGRKVLVIGGGDTGSDCVGTSNRHGAVAVTQVELMPCPPEQRSENTPWPQWPYQLRTSSSHKEGCTRRWDVQTKSFEGKDGRVTKANMIKVEWEFDALGRPMKFKEIAGSEFSIDTDLVLLAMGFVGPVKNGLLQELGLEEDARGNVKTDAAFMTSREGVFAAGDVASGASLVVRAIAAGRNLADSVNAFLVKK